MTPAIWLIWAGLAVAGFALARWMYRRRETPGRGRTVLAVLRGSVTALLLLLVFDPELPGGVRAGGGSAVVLDASLSMGLPGDGGTVRWSEAVTLARSAGASRVTLFGDAPGTAAIDSLARLEPVGTHSLLLPALRAVAEAGLHRATVITDGAIEDADEVARWLPRLGLDLRIEPVSGHPANRGLVGVNAPSWVETGQPVEITFELASTAPPGGPVTIVAMANGGEVARTVVESPAEGRVASGTLRFPAGSPGASEYARYDVIIETGDAVRDDDTRSVYVHVSTEPAGAVIVSFLPDWEPRFLQPVLERSLGMPVRGYLRSGSRWLAIGSGLKVGEGASDAEVQRAVERAELLVLHAFGADTPAWARQAAAEATRLMVLPAGDGQVPGLDLPALNSVAGDWYLSDDVPSSPVAPLLAGLDVRDVPPLASLRLVGRVAGTWTPAVVSRGRRGSPYPLALGGTMQGRRWVVALGEGYWRWAFWSAASRDAYERMWSALAGWLVDEPLVSGPDVVAPVTRVVPRARPIRWVAAGLAPDSVRVTMRDQQTAVVLDTVVAGAGTDTVTTRAMPPGHYTYAVTASGADAMATGGGELTVESYSDEFTRAPAGAAALEAALTPLVDAGRTRVPLHASVWPYVLIILLLSTEWVLRRRWGLR